MAKIGMMLVGLLIYTAAFAEKKPFKGDYDTGSIRYVWMVCATEMRRKFVPENIFWRICDCVTDSLRRRVGHKEYLGLDMKEQYTLTFEVTTECINQKSHEESI